jgi:23S rRNA (guanine745-N1)-methyltransferase
MTQISLTSLACPLDGQALTRHDRRFLCASGHSFDLAKRGYLHLLPAQNKRSKDPGDSLAMIQARQRFLAQGHYNELATALTTLSTIGDTVRLLDAGCGEGYYLRQLEQNAPHIAWHAAGLDISKPAIDCAAKLDKGFQYLVASNANIPLLDKSVDVVWCVFGFADYNEFKRILAPRGRLIMVDPGADHLLELRQIIYPAVKEKVKPWHTPAGFVCEAEQRLRGSMDLDNDALADLMVMTPHLYRASREGREQAAGLPRLTCQFDIQIRVLQPVTDTTM